MSNKTVYLAGPIGGKTYEGATEWRELAARYLLGYGIEALSPMRSKEYLKSEGVLHGGDYGHLSALSSGKGIVARDRNDSTKSNALLVNLLGAEKVSIGTMIELGWADAHRVPIVLVMEEPDLNCSLADKKNLHDHAMVREIANFIVEDLNQALFIVRALLLPDPVPALMGVTR